MATNTAGALDIQNKALDQMDLAQNAAIENINKIGSLLAATNINFDGLQLNAPNVWSPAGYAPAPTSPALPTFDAVVAPTAPAIGAFTIPNIGTIPAFTAVEPIINLPAAPSTALPGAPGGAPAVSAPALPTAPTLSLPDPPSFQPIAIPEATLVELPVFDAVADFGDVIAPTQNFEWSEQEYRSTLLDAVKSKLLNDILNGGYGIDDADERRLWDRARERELVNASAKLAELSRLHAARGFALPPGSLYAQQEEAQQDMLEKSSSLSRDIASKRADLYVENRKFAIQAAKEVEDMLIRYAGSMAERALNASRAQVELGIALFNAQVSRYNARLEAYRTFAAAYEARVRAALASVEIYKATVEGAKIGMEAQKLHADVYATQLQGANTLINLYRTQMEAARTSVDIQNLQLQGFKTEVEAYAEQVRAKAAEFGMFQAQIQGEMAKVQIYDASVKAYATRLAGVQTQAEIAKAVSQTEIAQAEAKLDIYKTDMERYRNEIGVVSEKIKALLQKYDSDLKGYSVNTEAIGMYSDHSVRAQEANARTFVAQAQIVAERLRTIIEQQIQLLNVGLGGTANAAQTSSALVSAWGQQVVGLEAYIK